MDRLSQGQQQRINLAASYVGLALVVLIVGLPLFWMLSSSLKSLREIYTFPPEWIPSDPKWSNYREAWNTVPFGRFYVNSIIITVLGAGLQNVNGKLCA